MDINDIKTMLNRVYELEGLLELATTREPSKIDSLAPLICGKCWELADLADEMKLHYSDEDTHFSHSSEVEIKDAPLAQNEEKKEVCHEPPQPESVAETEQKIFAEESSVKPTVNYADYPFPEEEDAIRNKEGKQIIAPLNPQEDEFVENPSESSSAPSQDENIEETTTEVIEDNKVDSEIHIPSPKEEIEDKPKSFQREIRRPDTARLFSINDNFRFRREIFHNNNEDFTQSLFLVDKMVSFADAEDYFYSDLQLDPEKEIVSEFMNIIKRKFI